MDKIILYKRVDGAIRQAVEFETVDRAELVHRLNTARATVTQLQTAIDKYDKLNEAQPGTDSEEKTVLRGVEDDEGRIHFVTEPKERPTV